MATNSKPKEMVFWRYGVSWGVLPEYLMNNSNRYSVAMINDGDDPSVLFYSGFLRRMVKRGLATVHATLPTMKEHYMRPQGNFCAAVGNRIAIKKKDPMNAVPYLPFFKRVCDEVDALAIPAEKWLPRDFSFPEYPNTQLLTNIGLGPNADPSMVYEAAQKANRMDIWEDYIDHDTCCRAAMHGAIGYVTKTLKIRRLGSKAYGRRYVKNPGTNTWFMQTK